MNRVLFAIPEIVLFSSTPYASFHPTFSLCRVDDESDSSDKRMWKSVMRKRLKTYFKRIEGIPMWICLHLAVEVLKFGGLQGFHTPSPSGHFFSLEGLSFRAGLDKTLPRKSSPNLQFTMR